MVVARGEVSVAGCGFAEVLLEVCIGLSTYVSDMLGWTLPTFRGSWTIRPRELAGGGTKGVDIRILSY